MSWFRKSTLVLMRRYSTGAKRGPWESVVGLEVHAQIQTNSKLFSPSSVKFGSPVNTQVSLFDASVPGTLPVLNRRCVEAAISTALALSCKVNMLSTFDRKHYFYADLPSGFQITQQRKPIAEYGELKFLVMPPGKAASYIKTCRIRQIQLEQDSGKSLHDEECDRSLIDLNRAGIALMELVFQPDLASGEEAAALVKELSLIMQTLGVCNCKMEEGALRVDANISVNQPGEGLGTRTEVKNLNSVRSLVHAIEYEIKRQIKVKEDGGIVINETRSYDSDLKTTLPMRDKEVQQDYRFMPEPNLPPLELLDDPTDTRDSITDLVNVAKIKENIVELPETTRQNLINDFNLRIETAYIIVATPGLVSFFLAVMKHIPNNCGVRAANVMLTEVMEQLNERNLTYENCPLKPEVLAEVIELIHKLQIHVSTAKDVLTLLFNGDSRTPTKIVQDENWITVTSDDVILEACERILKENPKLVENYRLKRKSKYMNKLIALVKQSVEKKIDMKKVTETLETMIKQEDGN
ncbi:Glutamyl-tRNA(Gln) amidotransferase subunit B, mitochondrial [Orchesella cincta]|uniref:Glutamyl-tRNA(Gln) amidotransferase subunit B, mitochondrial n=1 Tax=Orchesella cincta TaxID=48709 RepID=A0A1D2NDS1_ORCCI|nr:Glutamyl-tRNA(Gln) amidotransferase subunit B, mitochondrial [Orchesella cincta]